MLFVGEYIAKLDDKGRMVFPAELRAQSGASNTQYMVHKSIYDNSLEIYTLEAWAKYSEEIRVKINPSTREGSKLWEEFNRHRDTVTPDEKTGRILILKHLLDMIGVQKEVVFTGLDFKIKLRAKENVGSVMSGEEFADLFDKMMRQ